MKPAKNALAERQGARKIGRDLFPLGGSTPTTQNFETGEKIPLLGNIGLTPEATGYLTRRVPFIIKDSCTAHLYV